MKPSYFLRSLLVTALTLSLNPASAEQNSTNQDVSTSAVNPAAKTFSQQDLDQILAPIALYPDPLLAQIFMASTYPLEVVQAARWVKANPKITGKALEEAMTKQTWDPAVKSITAVPQVLQQMNDKIDWTQKLGDAFLAQQSDVMDTVQRLRAKAYDAGNLKSSEQQVVKTETQGTQTIYVVQPAKTEVVYVPTYNPTVVYGAWWYPAPPYAMYPPAYVYPPGIAFATGVVVGAAIWGNCHWGGYGNNNVNVNVNHYNSFNRTTASNSNWNHNAEHRGGVAYSDKNVAQQYNRGASAQTNQSREANRGYGDAGSSASTNDVNNRSQGNDRGQTAQPREASRGSGEAGRTASTNDMDARAQGGRNGQSGQGARPDSGMGGQSGNRSNDVSGGGFSGVSNSASTREASQRGSASRSDFSGGSGSRSGGSGGGGHRGGGGGRR